MNKTAHVFNTPVETDTPDLDISLFPPLPPTSLIICSRNRPEMLAETVHSIFQGTEVPSELIIIDQSDTENPYLVTLETDRACTIRYMWKRSIGLSRATNAGIVAAHHDLLVFTHDDVRVTPAWFGTLVRSLVEIGENNVVTGKVPPSEPEEPGGFQRTVQLSDTAAVYEGRTAAYPLVPLNMAMYRSAVQAVGGFDERLGPGTPFPGAEDVDLGFRLLEAGCRIVYVPGAILYHRAWRSPRDYFPIRWAYGVALGGFFAKHLALRDPHILFRMTREIRGRLIHSVRLLRSDGREAGGHLLSVAGIMYGLGRWMFARHLSSELRHYGDDCPVPRW